MIKTRDIEFGAMQRKTYLKSVRRKPKDIYHILCGTLGLARVCDAWPGRSNFARCHPICGSVVYNGPN